MDPGFRRGDARRGEADAKKAARMIRPPFLIFESRLRIPAFAAMTNRAAGAARQIT